MSTLREVAARAGVHLATASAVLNGAGGNTRVGKATRARILAAARHHAYVPNELARGLKTGRSTVVGFLGGDLRNPFFAELTATLEMELAKHGLRLIITHQTHTRGADLKQALGGLQQQRVKSIICWEEAGRTSSPEGGTQILAVGFTRRERAGVWLDLKQAILTAVHELRRRGYGKLGFFLPKGQQESPSARVRGETFTEICWQQGLATPVLASYEGESWDFAAAAHGAAMALARHRQVEAWLGFNDVAALALLRCAPGKLRRRVVCFDGTTLARFWPGRPLCLDLKTAEFARLIAAVVAGDQDAEWVGSRANWLQPTLAG